MGFLFDTPDIDAKDFQNFLTTSSLTDLEVLVRYLGQYYRDINSEYYYELLRGPLSSKDKEILSFTILLGYGINKTTHPFLEYLLLNILQSPSDMVKNGLMILYLLLIEQILGVHGYRTNTKNTISDSELLKNLKQNSEIIQNLEINLKEVSSKSIEFLQYLNSHLPEQMMEVILNGILARGYQTSLELTLRCSMDLHLALIEIKEKWYNNMLKIYLMPFVSNRKRLHYNLVIGLFDSLRYKATIDEEILPILNPFCSVSKYQIRLQTRITQWLVTNNLKYIRAGLKQATSKSETKQLQEILDNPSSSKKQITTSANVRYEQLLAKLKREQVNISDPDLIYIFSVSKLSKQIAIKGSQTLDHLHWIIYDYYDLDPDHLYAFFINNVAWSSAFGYFHPQSDGSSASDITIAELNLYVGKKLLYIYDFGTEFRRRLTLERIEKLDAIDIKPEDLPKLISK